TAKSIRLRIVAYIGEDALATSNEFVIVWEESIEYIYVYTPGEGNGSNDFDYVTEGTQITLYTPESMGFTPIDGFTFDYWSIRVGTAQSAEVAQKQPGDQITIDDNTYIVAIWKEAPLTEYMYLYSPGEANGSNDFDYVTNGTQITLYTPESMGFTPIEGFAFDYWSIRVGTAQSAEVAKKQPGDTIIINDNTYIIAMWKEFPVANYTVSFNANGGTGTMSPVEYAGTYTLPTCEFTAPDGKKFKGWATSASGEVIDGTTYNVTANVELFAIWEDIPHNHDYGTAWESDANEHWNECSCGDKANVGTHADSDNNGKCDTCDYQMANGGGDPESSESTEESESTKSSEESKAGKGCKGSMGGLGLLTAFGIFALIVIRKKV
ncbi:MAG: InlB B-repeat-containing protein, partial [Clostridia bacterium]|nr:InlB B-repeat-containing protein [Clostridia bacterium]